MRILIIILFSALTIFGQYGGNKTGGYGGANKSGYQYLNNYEPESKTYFASLTTPLSAAQKKRINLLVKMLKDSLQITSLSSAFDVFYIFANETQEAGLKNLVKRLHDATNVNSTTFTAFEGFTGDGISMYLNTNFNPTASGVNYTLNNGGRYFYIRTTPTSGKPLDGTEAELLALFLYSASAVGIRVNTSGNLPSAVDVSGVGYKSVVRTTNNNTIVYNGNTEKIFVRANSAMPNSNLTVLRTPTTYGDCQIAFYAVGRGLTAVENAKLNNIIEYYMYSLGKGVQ